MKGRVAPTKPGSSIEQRLAQLEQRITQLETTFEAWSKRFTDHECELRDLQTNVERRIYHRFNNGLPLDVATIQATLLRDWLALMVPLCIIELARKGGPTDEDLAQVKADAWDLAEGGDQIICFGELPEKQKAAARKLRLKMARAVAIGAFFPGGIKIFGLAFDARAMHGEMGHMAVSPNPEGEGERRKESLSHTDPVTQV